MDAKIRGYQLVDKFARVLYGMPITECFGHASSIKKKAIRDCIFVIHFPADKEAIFEAKHVSLAKTIGTYISSMIAHATRNNIVVREVVD
ncbi:MAG: hypothetical protein JSS09_02000 [Verrucomicrobia bacterium]|nr:hypothetical protein [Verrucomicrobiota bacterium]